MGAILQKPYAAKNCAQLGPLSIEVLGYQYPTSDEYWDANWLIMKIQCVDGQHIAKMTDACLTAPELHQLRDDLNALIDGAKVAVLEPMEPYFSFVLKRMNGADGFDVRVVMGVETNAEPDSFGFTVFHAGIVAFLEKLTHVLKAFPVRLKNDVL